MMARRVTFQEHEQALATSAKIKAKHPDILERGPDGLYRYLVGGEDHAPGAVRLPGVRPGGGSVGQEEEGPERGSGSAAGSGRDVLK